MQKVEEMFIGALIDSTLGVEILTCWVEEMVLTNISENPDIVMDKDADRTLLDLPSYSSELNPIEK
ncbi:hypothetical protein [Holospora curviuscula]|uniref:Tc1-like transposase DDE domain-containing protein n=1 Tax=Holospora curviuscula TaxID=1082868 RepID=A0A2S5R9R4_9PROT|nr:hypothetical protein [Holospora curviuscula]PPE04043.1 hypothetical protein HCUR_00578 [Holospora curviuscula]